MTTDLLHRRSRRLSVWWGLLVNPWWWGMVTAWSVVSLGTIRRDFVGDWLPHQLRVLESLPLWPWWYWALGSLGITMVFLGEEGYRRGARLEDALLDRALPARNASDIAPWWEKGRTLSDEWRHLAEHGQESPHQTAVQDAGAWREDMVARLTRKYGLWVADVFDTTNTTRQDDSAGPPVVSLLTEHEARAERLAQIMYDVGVGKIQPISEEPF